MNRVASVFAALMNAGYDLLGMNNLSSCPICHFNWQIRTASLPSEEKNGGEGGIRTSQAKQPKSFMERAFVLLRVTWNREQGRISVNEIKRKRVRWQIRGKYFGRNSPVASRLFN